MVVGKFSTLLYLLMVYNNNNNHKNYNFLACDWTVQKANHIQRCSLKQPITFKVVITCACALAFVFMPVTLECLRLLCQYFNANFPLFSQPGYFSWKL